MSKLYSNSRRDISMQYVNCRMIEQDDYVEVERLDRINMPYPMIYGKSSRCLGNGIPETNDNNYRITNMRYLEAYRAIYTTTIRRITNAHFRYSEENDDMHNPFIEYDYIMNENNPFQNYDLRDILGVGDCEYE